MNKLLLHMQQLIIVPWNSRKHVQVAATHEQEVAATHEQVVVLCLTSNSRKHVHIIDSTKTSNICSELYIVQNGACTYNSFLCRLIKPSLAAAM